MELSSPPGGIRPRACDNCRSRKIRCNRQNPCSNCQPLQISCHTSRREPERRQRILISEKYESQIEDVNRRLARLESTLDTFINEFRTGSPRQRTGAAPSSASDTLATREPPVQFMIPNEALGLSPFGDSSVTKHGSYFDQNTLHGVGEIYEDPRNRIPKYSANSLDYTRRVSLYANQQSAGIPLHETDISAHQLPSTILISQILDMIHVSIPQMFLEFPMLTVDAFSGLCQQVYSTNCPSSGAYLLFHGCLLELFKDGKFLSTFEPPIDVSEVRRLTSLCSNSISSSLAYIGAFLEPCLVNIQALFLAALHSVHKSRLSTAWTLISVAARLCQEGGFHCLPQISDDSDLDAKKATFWFVFSWEKMLSSRFGRPSMLPDKEITVGLPNSWPGTSSTSWITFYARWIAFSKLEGLLQLNLHATKPDLELDGSFESTDKVVAGFEKWQEEAQLVEEPDVPYKDLLNCYQEALWLRYYSTFTLVTGILPSQNSSESISFSGDCIRAARLALEMHHKLASKCHMDQTELIPSYVTWNLLIGPLTPFIIVFCSIIMTTNIDDLSLLQQSMATLESTSQLSVGVDRVYRICNAFFKVAEAFLKQNGYSQPPPVTGAVDNGYPLVSDDSRGPAFDMSSWNRSSQWAFLVEDMSFGLDPSSERDISMWLENCVVQNQNAGGTGP